MKKISVFILFFLVSFTLFGQNFREAKIHVPPIDGAGRAEDNVYFYKQLTYEVILQYHTLVRSSYGSDYTLKGTIEPLNGIEFDISYTEEEMAVKDTEQSIGPIPSRPIPPVRASMHRRDFFSWEIDNGIYFFDASGEENYEPGSAPLPPAAEPEPAAVVPDGEEYIFKLEMIDSKTGEVLSGQSIIYYTPDASVNELLSIIIYNMLSGIPDETEFAGGGDWRDKWFFFEISALWAPRYGGSLEEINWVNFGGKLTAELHFASFLSFGIGVQIVQESIVLKSTVDEEFTDILLEVPIFLKLVFKPSGYFLLEPYGGVSFNYSLQGTTVPSTMSWFAGLQFGFKAGPGAIVLDPRFAMDFYNSTLPDRKNEYKRICMQLGLGYKFGVGQKRTRIKEY